jgi:predicted anti-sigma-YlaC factor YlaD
MVTKSQDICAVNLIPAYIDGELEDDARVLFERHVEVCGDCRAELTAHRLFICELDTAMAQSMDVVMPADFSRVVAARAESDMSGVRSSAEHRRALSICVILALVALALLGTSARTSLVTVGRIFAGKFFGAAGFLWTAFYDAAASATVIFRVLSRKVFFESGSLGLLIVLLALAAVLLFRLISNYHRTGATY